MYCNVSPPMAIITGGYLNKYHVHSSMCSSYCQSEQKSKRQKPISFISNALGSKYDSLFCHECNVTPSSDITMNKGDQIMSQSSLVPAIITQEDIDDDDDEYENGDDYNSIICNKMPSQTQVDELILQEDQTMADPPGIPINFDKESTPLTPFPLIQPHLSPPKFQADRDIDGWLKPLSDHVDLLPQESKSLQKKKLSARERRKKKRKKSLSKLRNNHILSDSDSGIDSDLESETESDSDLDELKDQDHTKIYDRSISSSPVLNSHVNVNSKKWKPSGEASSQVCSVV